MKKRSFYEDMPFLSYYQSSLRNIIVFTTLSMGFIRQAVVNKDKNKIYNILYLCFSVVFIAMGLNLNWILLQDTQEYDKDKDKSMEVDKYLSILYTLLCLMIVFLLFIMYRIYVSII
jgi:hypothetical protein